MIFFSLHSVSKNVLKVFSMLAHVGKRKLPAVVDFKMNKYNRHIQIFLYVDGTSEVNMQSIVFH